VRVEELPAALTRRRDPDARQEALRSFRAPATVVPQSLAASLRARSAESWGLGPPCELLGTMPLRIGCPMGALTRRGVSDFDAIFSKATDSWSFPFLILLSGCDAKPECDSFETRKAVLQAVSDDHNNALANTRPQIRLWRNRVTRVRKLKNRNNNRYIF
jgi:hypothetical protein